MNCLYCQSRPISTAPLPSTLSTTTPNTTSSLTPVISNTSVGPSSLQNLNMSCNQSSVPIRIHRPNTNRSSLKTPLSVKKLQSTTHPSSPIIKKLNEMSSQTQPISTISLDSIVTEYLRKQHALCKNPVVTCPPFDLFTPHRCPEPLNRDSAPLNITTRIQRRSIFPRFGGHNGSKMDRKFIYSRFRPIRSYRDPESSSSFSSCAFSVSRYSIVKMICN